MTKLRLMMRAGAFALVGAAAAWGPQAMAQSTSGAQAPPSDLLAPVTTAAGGNPQLLAVGNYITNVCYNMVRTGGVPPTTSSGNDLLSRCGDIVLGAPGRASIAAAALDAVAPQEILAQTAVVDGAIRPATSAVAARIATIGRLSGRYAALNRPIVLAMQGDTAGVGDGVSAGGLQGFANVVLGTGDQDTNTYETGFDYDQRSITVGLDHTYASGFTVGVSIGYSEVEMDFVANQGSMEADSWIGSLYGLWPVSEKVTLSGLVAYGKSDYGSSRRIAYAAVTPGNAAINYLASGDTDGKQWEATVTANYEMSSGGAWSYGPSAQVSARWLDVDGFNETGSSAAGVGLLLGYGDQEAESLQFALGFDVAKAISTKSGVISPYARIQGIYEADDDQRDLSIRFLADPTGFFPNGTRITTSPADRWRALLGAGVSAQLSSGWSLFVDGETVLGLEDATAYNLTLGVRKAF